MDGDNEASKGVFIFKDFNFVIKIPFSYYDGGKLCGDVEGGFDWDYCSQEVNRYDNNMIKHNKKI